MILLNKDYATVEADCWLLTVEAWVHFQSSFCETCSEMALSRSFSKYIIFLMPVKL
jgi:hypothetical protein